MKILDREIIEKWQLKNNRYYFIVGMFKIAYWDAKKCSFIVQEKKEKKELEHKDVKPFFETKYCFEGDFVNETTKIYSKEKYNNELNKIKGRRPYYTACFLNESTQVDLIFKFRNKIPSDWVFKCHHMTMNFGDCNKEFEKHLGESAILKITHFGIDYKLQCAAFKVESEIPSANDTKHITFAIGTKGKAVNSNYITQWVELDEQIEVMTTVGKYLNNRAISFAKQKQ